MSATDPISRFADLPIDLEVQLDRFVIKLREVAELQKGSLLRLQRAAGENLDVLVGGALIGCGEITVIESSVSIRLTDLREEH